MAVEYMGKEWEKAMQEGLAAEFSTKGRVSTVFAQVMTDGPGGKQLWAVVEIDKGMYVRYEVGEGDVPAHELAAVGPYAVHKGCVKGELDGSECLMKGLMKLTGNVLKGMKLLGTYSRMEQVEQSIEIL